MKYIVVLTIIGTKCRLSFIQYLPAKPTKWGLYVQMLLQDIFIHNEVYCGANNLISIDCHLLLYLAYSSFILPSKSVILLC